MQPSRTVCVAFAVCAALRGGEFRGTRLLKLQINCSDDHLNTQTSDPWKMGFCSSALTTPPILKVPTLIGWDFFCLFPSENRNDVARVAPAVARFPPRFPQIPLSVISRDASARAATSSIFNDLQAAGSRSNLVWRWGIEK